jgi:hypothetical protein
MPLDQRGQVHIIFGPDNADLRDQTKLMAVCPGPKHGVELPFEQHAEEAQRDPPTRHSE